MHLVKWIKGFLLTFCLSVMAAGAYAQTKEIDEVITVNYLQEAQKYAAVKNYDSALPLYRKLYEESGDPMYPPYLNTLILAKKYKDAEKLINSRLGNNNLSYIPEIDLGRVYKLQGKDAKATEQWESVLKKINGDDMVTQRVVKAFVDADVAEYAIKVYEKATHILGNPYVYALQCATLYAKSGQIDKAMEVMLTGNPGQYTTTENVKTLFLEWMGNDPKKLQTAQKYLLARINQQPDNTYFVELLTWIYTQKNDWDGALMQMEAIDERNKETGRRLIDFAHTAVTAQQYEAANKAYDDVIAKGDTLPLYAVAKSEKINVQLMQLKNAVIVKPEEVTNLMAQYASLLNEFPKYYATQVAGDYAMVAAQYADSVDKAIQIIQRAIKNPDTRKQLAGAFKLQLGDYYILKGKVWDASLTYSQVDKDFRQDMLSEDARFRIAKLNYYRGDFEWAQSMLTVLKRSTSELIANDALFLSVQITENVEDSFFYPLSRFAHADLLLFQNKDKQAETLLDSISTAFPKHPLNDDILMQHALIAEKHHEFDRALGFLTDVYKKYGQDVLADDALFRMAEIYRNDLKNKDKAKEYYEQLIIDYPGSTFVQTARLRLQEMTTASTQ